MPVASPKRDFVILYGSQTGQAEAISEEIFDRAIKEKLNAARYCLSQTEKKFSIEKEQCVVIVCSTTGEGEPPDTAQKFYRRIKKKTLPSNYLSNLHFALLALGDSNYTNFCNCGKGIDRQLQNLGALHFYETGYADDAVGLEVVVEPWIEGLLSAIKRHLRIPDLSSSFELVPRSVSIDVVHEEKPENCSVALEMLVSSEMNSGGLSVTESTTTGIPKDDLMNGSALKGPNLCSNETSVEAGLLNGNDQQKVQDISAPLPVSSLRYSVPPLSESALKIPSSSEAFLVVRFLSSSEKVPAVQVVLPNAETVVQEVALVNARYLTSDPLVKRALELELDVSSSGFRYEPGDSFGILCRNRCEEVGYLINRLGILADADKCITLEISSDTKKKGAKVPEYISIPSTMRKILSDDLDFRAVPRKALLRMLVDYTSDPSEKRRLQELCSIQGAEDYAAFVRESVVGLSEILKTFSSCCPPVERLFEHLPRLLPREYSVACSPLACPSSIKFAFNVIELPDFDMSKRYGLCTQWLESLATSLMKSASSSTNLADDDLDVHFKRLAVESLKVPVYMRRPTSFRFPSRPEQPLIMIGPGTGVAPFIGFLQHRERLLSGNPSLVLGSAWLFFGCRYREKDFFYRDELERLLASRLLSKLILCFSRETVESVDGDAHPKYVQHNIVKYKNEVMDLVFNQNAAVFICGDAKHMGRDVTNAFIQLIEEWKNVSKADAVKILTELRDRKQFIEDVWT